MAAESKKEIELEIAHVLFLDIVGYSKLSVNEQHARVDELNGIVRLSEQFRKAEAANRILKIPPGDGMALVFYKSPEEPAQCAFEISRALKNNQRLQVRMGIHSGPVSGVVDVICSLYGSSVAKKMPAPSIAPSTAPIKTATHKVIPFLLAHRNDMEKANNKDHGPN